MGTTLVYAKGVYIPRVPEWMVIKVDGGYLGRREEEGRREEGKEDREGLCTLEHGSTVVHRTAYILHEAAYALQQRSSYTMSRVHTTGHTTQRRFISRSSTYFSAMALSCCVSGSLNALLPGYVSLS